MRTFPVNFGAANALYGGGIVIAALLLGFLIYALMAIAFTYIAAAVATAMFILVVKLFGWRFEINPKGLFQILQPAFLTLTIVIWVIDQLAHTYFSTPAMVVAMGYLQCHPNCMASASAGLANAKINSLGDYYAFAVGSSALDWGRYLLFLTPGVATIAASLWFADDAQFQRPTRKIEVPGHPGLGFITDCFMFKGPGSAPSIRLVIASLAIVAAAYAIAFPAFMLAYLFIRDNIGR